MLWFLCLTLSVEVCVIIGDFFERSKCRTLVTENFVLGVGKEVHRLRPI